MSLTSVVPSTATMKQKSPRVGTARSTATWAAADEPNASATSVITSASSAAFRSRSSLRVWVRVATRDAMIWPMAKASCCSCSLQHRGPPTCSWQRMPTTSPPTRTAVSSNAPM